MSAEFTQLGRPPRERFGHTETRLADGRVLITGGGPAGGATAEIFDPATGGSTPLTGET